jgi:hypothetical protein
MTTRQRLNRDFWRGTLFSVLGFVMFAGGMAASEAHREFMFVGLCGFALMAGSIVVYGFFRGRCVHCHRSLGKLFYQEGAFGVPSHVQFCPYCGKSLDDDVTI